MLPPAASLRPIGVFDSGVGGLSVLRALQAELPLELFVYVADNGHAPYGERDDAHVLARSHAITDYLIAKHGIKALVVACNTATAAAIHILRAAYPDLPIIGIEPALKPATAVSKTGNIGVMATRGTLNSEKFRRLLDSLHGTGTFVLQPCDGLAIAIERMDADQTVALCREYVHGMGRFGTQAGEMDCLVLGCTHYAFAASALRRHAALWPGLTRTVPKRYTEHGAAQPSAALCDSTVGFGRTLAIEAGHGPVPLPIAFRSSQAADHL